ETKAVPADVSSLSFGNSSTAPLITEKNLAANAPAAASAPPMRPRRLRARAPAELGVPNGSGWCWAVAGRDAGPLSTGAGEGGGSEALPLSMSPLSQRP